MFKIRIFPKTNNTLSIGYTFADDIAILTIDKNINVAAQQF